MANENVDVAELVKQHAELGEQIVKLGGKITYPDSDDADLKAKKTKKSLERVKLDKAKSKAKAEDDSEDEEDPEDMLDGGDDEDTEDEGGKKKVKKAAVIEKGADETLVYQNQTIKKSVVGEAQFAVFKGLTADLAKAADDIAKAQDEALMARLEKRAGDEFSHVPGTVQERAAMLKAIGTMDEAVRKSFEAVLTSAEKLAKTAFDTIGNGGGDMENIKKSKQDFETKVTEIAKRDSIGRAAAMAKARTEHSDLFKAYQEAN